MNVELARQALESAKAKPERFNMNSWFTGPRGGNPRAEVTEEHVPPCGTTACFAGWVAFHHAPAGSRLRGADIRLPGEKGYTFLEQYAAEALDITPDQAGVLFYLEGIEEVSRAVDYLADSPDASYGSLFDRFIADDE